MLSELAVPTPDESLMMSLVSPILLSAPGGKVVVVVEETDDELAREYY